MRTIITLKPYINKQRNVPTFKNLYGTHDSFTPAPTRGTLPIATCASAAASSCASLYTRVDYHRRTRVRNRVIVFYASALTTRASLVSSRSVCQEFQLYEYAMTVCICNIHTSTLGIFRFRAASGRPARRADIARIRATLYKRGPVQRQRLQRGKELVVQWLFVQPSSFVIEVAKL